MRTEMANIRTREERRRAQTAMAQSRQRAMEGSASPADIVSTPLTSKAWDYEESEGLQTMGGEENNIKVSRTFESG